MPFCKIEWVFLLEQTEAVMQKEKKNKPAYLQNP